MGEVGRDGRERVSLRESASRHRTVGGVDARRDACRRGSLTDADQGRLELVVHARIVRVRTTHGEAQIGRPDVDPVESGDGADLLHVRQSLRVSIITTTTVWRLASAGVGPIRSWERIGPYERTPAGGYVAPQRPRAASSAVFTSGTITPAAPASSARPIGVGSFDSTRIMPTVEPEASMAVSPATMPEYPIRPCWRSRAM